MRHTAYLLSFLLVGCQPVQIINQAGIPAPDLIRAEGAATVQMHDLHNAWGTPDIQFTTNQGWPVTIAPPTDPQALSFHNGGPSAYVWTDGHTSLVSNGTRVPWTQVFSHELMEMFANPCACAQRAGWPLEVSDPVLAVPVTYQGQTMDDFVTPSWFGGPGPWDYAGALHGPFQQIR